MQGYKVFNPDFTCLGFQFEVGKTYIHNGELKLCKSGFHFCEQAKDCFSYYLFNSDNIVCEILAEDVSNEKDCDSKRVCRKITIVKRLEWYEVLKIVNLGKGNSGYCNSGNSNSGDYNSGNFNSGFFNTNEPTIRIFGKDSGFLRYQIDVPFFNVKPTKVVNNKVVAITYKEAWKIAWKNTNKSEKDKLFNLKDINGNLLFDEKMFEEITGINVKETP